MNVLQAEKALSVHLNTICSRVQRIRDMTGQNAFSFHDLNELLLAIDCVEG
jgi:sugar diacid utilization regulator|tara:strand:- start:36 stop:188 length:153 start_codon:yes stop_codon:yes gene_type:complete